MNVGLDGVRKGQQEVKGKLKILDDQINAINKQIEILDAELKDVVEKRDKTYEHILELRKQREEGVCCSASLLTEKSYYFGKKGFMVYAVILRFNPMFKKGINPFVCLW